MSRPLLVAVALLAACTAEVEHPYDQPGPYTPGTTSVVIEGSTGLELDVQVWYPSDEAGAAAVEYGGLLEGEAFTDVAPACDQPRPTLAFSHGNAGVRWQSPWLGEHLASHGWVVVAPGHVGNTTFDYDADRFAEVVVRRPVDVADAYDGVAARPDLGDCVDPDGYAVAGHSFGGYTAFAVAGAVVNDPEGEGTLDLSDPRVTAAIPMAPWRAGGALTDGPAAVEVPTMVLGGTRDQTTPWSMISGLYDELTVEPRRLGEFPEAGHFSFTPVACELATYDGDGCGDDYIDLEVFTGLVQTSALAFLETHRGTPGAALEFPEQGADLKWTVAP